MSILLVFLLCIFLYIKITINLEKEISIMKEKNEAFNEKMRLENIEFFKEK